MLKVVSACRGLLAPFVLFVGLLLISKPTAADDGTKPFDMEGPQVLLPPTVTATRKRGPDFYLYYFTVSPDARGGGDKKRRQVLFAYVGFAPSFPNAAPKNVKEAAAQVNGKPARTLNWKDKNGGRGREVLVKTGRSDFAEYVHFIYAGLTEADVTLADGIIATVRPSGAAAKPNAKR